MYASLRCGRSGVGGGAGMANSCLAVGCELDQQIWRLLGLGVRESKEGGRWEAGDDLEQHRGDLFRHCCHYCLTMFFPLRDRF